VKKLFLLLIALCSFLLAWTQRYEPTDKGSSVAFGIRNMGLTVEGTFNGLKGSIFFDPNELVLSKFEISINAGSIDTGIDLRNKHLKKEEYFDVANFTEIRFVSTKIEALPQPGKFTVTGKLTIKKVAKEIKFDFTADRQGTGYFFKGEFSIDRRDYKVGGNSFSMSDNVKVFLSVASTLDKT
jgi:polyisoprenoid-binding protein YceI